MNWTGPAFAAAIAALPLQVEAHEGMHHAEPAPGVSTATIPAPAGDHAADAYFDARRMAAARAMLRHEAGGMGSSMLLVDRLEYAPAAKAYAFEGQAWFGADLDRLTLKLKGEGDRDRLDGLETQALYSRALDPWFNLQLGLRHDIRPRPNKTYAVIGVEGLAPYWFEVGGAMFVSEDGDLSARFKAEQDFRLTQSLLLTPQVEIDWAAQSVPELHVEEGLSKAEAGLRLHYLVTPRFAPYVGVNWERHYGFEENEATRFVFGLRGWF